MKTMYLINYTNGLGEERLALVIAPTIETAVILIKKLRCIYPDRLNCAAEVPPEYYYHIHSCLNTVEQAWLIINNCTLVESEIGIKF